jgi:hypothetical protein
MFDELSDWVKLAMRPNLRRTLDALADDKSWIHRAADRYTITRSGQQEVEARGWLDPI